MSVDVSVVIPVYNPGPNIAQCIDSLFEVTLPRDRFEAIFVDDGSTDGSGELLDKLAAEHPGLIRVAHIPNSGWPGRPRNIGVDMALGRYVQFMDNDDALAPEGLERCLKVADESQADLVMGKLVSNFRGVIHAVFAETVTGLTIEDWRPVYTLTPHKMFRKQFLVDHDIRFAEGKVNLEDQLFCMQAYVHATSMAIVAEPCYYYLARRAAGRNAGTRLLVPKDYYADLDRVLEVVAEHVKDPVHRERLQRRFYREEMLRRVRSPFMNSFSKDYRLDLVTEMRALALRRFTETTHAGLPFFVRAQSRLLLDGDIDAMIRWSDVQESLALRGHLTGVRWESGRLEVSLRAALHLGNEPLRLDRDGEGWLLPAGLAAGDAERRLPADALTDVEVDLAVKSRGVHASYLARDGLTVAIADDGQIVVEGTALIDPATIKAGGPLEAGLWDVNLRLNVGGLLRTTALRMAADQPTPAVSAWLYDGDAQRSVTAYYTNPKGELALDVDEWMHALQKTAAGEASLDSWDRDSRALRLRLPGIRGDVARWPASVTLTSAVGAPQTCPATLVATEDGSALSATMPGSPPSVGGWKVALTIGLPGGMPATALPVGLPPASIAGAMAARTGRS